MGDETVLALSQRLSAAIQEVVVAREQTIDLLVATLLAGGHVLLEDVPGVGKTLLANTLARSLDASFHRIQFTPDLLPSDITGAAIFDQRRGDLVFAPGPVFANIVLADEINRATPRTQSALLEAMGEGQVTVDGVTHPLPDSDSLAGPQGTGWLRAVVLPVMAAGMAAPSHLLIEILAPGISQGSARHVLPQLWQVPASPFVLLAIVAVELTVLLAALSAVVVGLLAMPILALVLAGQWVMRRTS